MTAYARGFRRALSAAGGAAGVPPARRAEFLRALPAPGEEPDVLLVAELLSWAEPASRDLSLPEIARGLR